MQTINVTRPFLHTVSPFDRAAWSERLVEFLASKGSGFVPYADALMEAKSLPRAVEDAIEQLPYGPLEKVTVGEFEGARFFIARIEKSTLGGYNAVYRVFAPWGENLGGTTP